MNSKPSLKDHKYNLELNLLSIHGTEAFFGIIQFTEQLMTIHYFQDTTRTTDILLILT